MTTQELLDKYPGIQPEQIAWRLQHPLIPDDKYERILELEAQERAGDNYYGDEEEAYEILGAYYPEEAE